MAALSPRRVAFNVLRQVNSQGAYANLALAEALRANQLSPRDAGLATELVAGTCRAYGTYAAILETAAGRSLGTLQPAVVDLLMLGTHQLLALETKPHAAVGETVALARETVGQRVTGLVNAILRKVSRASMEQWLARASQHLPAPEAAALRAFHPGWIVDAYAQLLPPHEVAQLLSSNNQAPVPTLVVRPGLSEVSELPGHPTHYSPFGAQVSGPLTDIEALRQGRAGVQDEGSQLVAWVLSRVEAPRGPWLDLCAGPGGKAALLTGLAREDSCWLLASESQHHRAKLVERNLLRYPDGWQAITADATRPAWSKGQFSRVMADVPCTGLGALRRRPEARWRRKPEELEQLVALQEQILTSAIHSACDGGVVAYVTCSPHPRETAQVVDEVLARHPEATRLPAAGYLPEVPDCAAGDDIQLWTHRHGTDSMFCSLLRVQR